MGLDMQIIKPPPPQCYYAVPLEIAVQSAQMVTTALPSSSRASRTAPGSSRPSFKAPRDAASGMPGVNGNTSNTSRVRHT